MSRYKLSIKGKIYEKIYDSERKYFKSVLYQWYLSKKNQIYDLKNGQACQKIIKSSQEPLFERAKNHVKAVM